MLYMRLQGGLGNQLYTYSFGKALSAYLGVELVLDLFDFGVRKYEDGTPYKWAYFMGGLNIPERVATEEEFDRLENSLQDKEICVYKPLLFPYIKELYGKSPNKTTFCVSLMGDDWRYHEPVVNALREQLTPLPVANGSRDLMWEIRSSESIGMHIRLGDYTTTLECLVLPKQYYHDCLTILRRSTCNPRVYVFTDSPDMVRGQIEGDIPITLVEGNDPVTDMALLSACKHKIIANSSFSFWAARLDGRKGGITLAPETYFLPINKHKDVPPPSYPPEWRVVPVRFPDGYIEELLQWEREKNKAVEEFNGIVP